MARAMVLNGTKMGVYDQISGMIKDSGVVPKGGFICSFRSFPHSFLITMLINSTWNCLLFCIGDINSALNGTNF